MGEQSRSRYSPVYKLMHLLPEVRSLLSSYNLLLLLPCIQRSLARCILTQILHDSRHLVHSAQSWEFEAVDLVEVTSILCVNLFQSLFQRASDTSIVSYHLTDQHRCNNSIFVTYIWSCKVSVTFLGIRRWILLLRLLLLTVRSDLRSHWIPVSTFLNSTP